MYMQLLNILCKLAQSDNVLEWTKYMDQHSFLDLTKGRLRQF